MENKNFFYGDSYNGGQFDEYHDPSIMDSNLSKIEEHNISIGMNQNSVQEISGINHAVSIIEAQSH